ncbi:MAG TPA: hypothetical protein EYF98_10785, partial [Planctomycetes bacterium]|nr:hypothetical protein [Planctomycetota bacterium]
MDPISMIIMMVAMSLLSMLLAPTPDIEDAKKGGMDEFGFPTNMENRSIPLAFGTNRLTGPNLIWYGDLRARPVHEDVGGWFKTKIVTTAWKYYVGFDLALCAGPIDEISRVQI